MRSNGWEFLWLIIQGGYEDVEKIIFYESNSVWCIGECDRRMIKELFSECPTQMVTLFKVSEDHVPARSRGSNEDNRKNLVQEKEESAKIRYDT